MVLPSLSFFLTLSLTHTQNKQREISVDFFENSLKNSLNSSMRAFYHIRHRCQLYTFFVEVKGTQSEGGILPIDHVCTC